MSKIALTIALCVAPTVVAAQTVYRCTGPNGAVTYSQAPCGKDAKLIMGSPTSAKQATSAEDNARTALPKSADDRRPDPNLQAISDSVDDSNCRRNAQRLFVIPSQARVEQVNRQIAELNSRVYANGYGQTQVGNAAIANQQVEQEIISLRQVISTEQARNDSIVADSNRRVADALAECDRKKAEREKAAMK